MSNRTDRWPERTVRWAIFVVALIGWSTVGLAMWIFLAARVGLAYAFDLFRGAAGRKNLKGWDKRLDSALHWWLDGYERILQSRDRSSEPEEHDDDANFWRELVVTITGIALFIALYFGLPTSKAIYSSVRGLFPTAVTPNSRLPVSQPPTDLPEFMRPPTGTSLPIAILFAEKDERLAWELSVPKDEWGLAVRLSLQVPWHFNWDQSNLDLEIRYDGNNSFVFKPENLPQGETSKHDFFQFRTTKTENPSRVTFTTDEEDVVNAGR